VLDEFGDAAGEAELGVLAVALIGQRDFQAFVQEGELAEPLRKRVKAVNGCGENFGVRVKGDLRSGFPGFTGSFQLGCGTPFS
jgi:hypothetical protein